MTHSECDILLKYKILAETHVNKIVHHCVWGLSNHRMVCTVVHHMIQVSLSLYFLLLVFLKLHWCWRFYVYAVESGLKWPVPKMDGLSESEWSEMTLPDILVKSSVLINFNETANLKEVLFFDRAFSRIFTVHLHLWDRPFSSTSMDQILTFTSVTKINIVCSYLSIRELHQRNTIKLKNWSIKNSTGFREWILWDLLKSFLPENSLKRCDMRSW